MDSVIRSLKKENPSIRRYDQSYLSDFIQIFHEHEPLWNSKHPDYSKRNVREVCYDALVEKMQETQPDSTRDDVTKKINSLRCSFRKEYKKVLKAEEKGEVHIPRLWYYNRLLFLIGQDSATQDSDFDNTRCEDKSEDLEYDDPLEDVSLQTERPHSEEEDFGRSVKRVRVPYKRKKQRVSSTQAVSAVQESHSSIFGRHVASKLSTVGDDQRVFLEKLINDAIFEAELGNLSRDSRIIAHYGP